MTDRRRIRTTFIRRRPGAARDTRPPAMMTSPLIAVQFVMREHFDSVERANRWAGFMAGYRERFRAGGLAPANTFAIVELARLGSRCKDDDGDCDA